MPKLTETDIRMEIDEELKNKGWRLTGKNKNVFGENYSSQTFADYILKPKGWESPLIAIEAKKVGQNLEDALEQAINYVRKRKAPIAYAIVGNPKKKLIKTWHLKTAKPLYLDQKEVNFLLDEKIALHYINTNEYNPAEIIIVENRRQLIQIFSFANNQLRTAGLTEGDERFSEFCSILFLKLLSEDEEKADKDKRRSPETIIPFHLRWEAFKNKEGDELLSHVNNALACKGGKHEEKIFCCFQKKYGEDIFQSLQVKKPEILKRIIDKMTSLHLSSIKSDIKGDAFEYFLKEALKKDKQDLGQYFTPRHIVDFLIRLVNPGINESVYDPFCGTGGILIKVFHYICGKIPKNDKGKLKRLKEGVLYGNELTRIARVAKMNMILTGDGHNNIKKIDSLENPAHGKYDIVITNMPFSLKGSFDEYKDLYYLGKGNGNSLCIEHILDAVNKNYGDRRTAFITLEGVLTDRKFIGLRKYIYENWHIEYIIALPDYAFKPYAEAKAVILYLTKKREQNYIWHFTIQNDGYTANTKREKKEGENDFDVFWKYKDSEESQKLQFGFQKLDMEIVRNNNFISIPNVYKKFTFETQYQLISLGELVEELTTRNSISAPVWSVTNDRGFVLSEENFSERVASKDISNYKLVLSQNFAYSPPRINVGSINYNDGEKTGCVSPIYIVFKVKNQEKIIPQYLFCLFQSKQFKEQVKSFCFGGVRQSLSFESFAKIIIPVPLLEEQQKTVNELNKIKESIKNSQKTIDNLNSALSLSLMKQKQLKNWETLPPLNTVIIPNLVIKENIDFFKQETLTSTEMFWIKKRNILICQRT